VAVDALTGSNPAIQDEDLVPSERRFRHDGTKATRFYEPDGDRPPAGRALASAHHNPEHGWTSILRVVRDALCSGVDRREAAAQRTEKTDVAVIGSEGGRWIRQV
jgi:hypothetical protein